MLKGLGCSVTDLGILRDNQSLIESSLQEASRDHDLIITSGGVSAGEEDHVRAAIESVGKLYMWRLAIKPGRPIALGSIGGVTFIGLPGNTVAAMITFIMIARPLILWMSGVANTTLFKYSVLSGFTYEKKRGRREWVRVRLTNNADGVLTAYKEHPSGAGILTSMVGAHGLVELPENTVRIEPGDHVLYIPFNGVFQ